MPETLPTFIYHPEPFATGSLERSSAVCEICNRNRGVVYSGPVYCEAEVETICPWCIADGRAHEAIGAEFTDIDGVGGYGDWSEAPETVRQQIAYRTPGFSGWQQERWFTHCNDAAIFLGPVGRQEIEAAGPAAIDAIREEASHLPDGDWRHYFQSMSRAGQPTAYLFRCRHCGTYGGYSDHT
jgi:uncharacterized protein